MKPKSMMGIASPTGSHLPTLEAAVAALPSDALVIEHGAGLYSTPLLARYPVRVLCSEPHPAWREWALWMYQGEAKVFTSWQAVESYLPRASLVFIDGPAAERGPLLSACLSALVPAIVVYDTDEGDWAEYGLRPQYFSLSAYDVSHTAEGSSHRTTLWRKHTGVPFDP